MSRETVSKPLPRAFALLAVALLALCALGGVTASEDTDAVSTGSQSSPLSSLSCDANDIGAGTTFYVKVGGSVSVTFNDHGPDTGIYCCASVTSGYGLAIKDSGLLLSGTLSKAGTITVNVDISVGGNAVNGVFYIEAVKASTLVTSISITGSSSVNKGSSTTFRASVSPSGATDKTVTWSVSSGSSYVSISSSGTSCTVTGKAVGTATIKCTANDGSGVSATKTITVKNPTYYYWLWFNMNGGSGGPSDIREDRTTEYSSVNITIPSDVPTKSGYKFLGWSKSSTATTASYQPGDSVSVTTDGLDLYAVWQENKQYYYAYLYYNANGGTGAPSTQSDSIYASSASGSKSFTISNTKPTKSGYDFLGWSTSNTATTASYQPGSSISVSYGSSKTLYAVWKETTYTSTLNFSANGGTGAPSALSYTGTSTSAHSFTIPSTTPTKSGFVFLGWSESSTATTASYQPGGTVSVAHDGTKTLYAVWQTAQLDITSEPATKSLKVGQSWSYTPTTNISGCTVTVSGADWLSVSNGKISGTPTTAGSYDVTVTVSKDGYVSDTQTFTLKVYSALGFNSLPGANGMFAYAE